MVGLSQLLLRSHSANGLIEDYAACLELRSEECQIIEDSSVDPGVLIMQAEALPHFREWCWVLLWRLKGAPFTSAEVRKSMGAGRGFMRRNGGRQMAGGGDEGSEDGAAQGSERRCRTRVLGGKSSSLSAGAEPGF
ncbi:UNVERIFIED_CONTAM: Nuclear pore complex protein [Sesamum radiatum]|uniref:Nuclear pore complex protein n=1 Tax=Sesamum radiatum TaxID=300843 RepID=A0AAW2KR41_SESRA